MNEIKRILISDKNYPPLLKKIPNPPKLLYYRGTFKKPENILAIIGSRNYSPYGKKVTLTIGRDLAKANFTIVSGLALGIDTFAHKVALKENKRTIAVLGTGLDIKSIYPKENISLAEEIVKKGGLLISEYPPGTPGSKITFPQRNRIVSGLAIATLVIESQENSGSHITAHWAKKQQRRLFAVPGSIYNINSKGNHKLIKEGAKLVESAEDILADLASFKNLTLK